MFPSVNVVVTYAHNLKIRSDICFTFFFLSEFFFHDHSRITGLQGKGEGIRNSNSQLLSWQTNTQVFSQTPSFAKYLSVRL